jgi:hypothetical protein
MPGARADTETGLSPWQDLALLELTDISAAEPPQAASVLVGSRIQLSPVLGCSEGDADGV